MQIRQLLGPVHYREIRETGQREIEFLVDWVHFIHCGSSTSLHIRGNPTEKLFHIFVFLEQRVKYSECWLEVLLNDICKKTNKQTNKQKSSVFNKKSSKGYPGCLPVDPRLGQTVREVQPLPLYLSVKAIIVIPAPLPGPNNRPKLSAENYLFLEIQLFNFKFTLQSLLPSGLAWNFIPLSLMRSIAKATLWSCFEKWKHQ